MAAYLEAACRELLEHPHTFAPMCRLVRVVSVLALLSTKPVTRQTLAARRPGAGCRAWDLGSALAVTQAQAFLRKYRELAKDVPGADVEPPAKRPRGATTATTSFSFHVKLSGAESLRL